MENEKTTIILGFEKRELIIIIEGNFDLSKLGSKEAETGILFSKLPNPIWINTKKLLYARTKSGSWTKEDLEKSRG